MRNRNLKANPATFCVCSVCEAEHSNTIPNKPHRKCGGQPGAGLKGPKDRLPGNRKGVWQVPGPPDTEEGE